MKLLFSLMIMSLSSLCYSQVDINGYFLNHEDSIATAIFQSDGEGDWIFIDSTTYRSGFVVNGLHLNKLYGIIFTNLGTGQEYKVAINTVQSANIEDVMIYFSKEGEPLETRCDVIYFDGEEYKIAVVI